MTDNQTEQQVQTVLETILGRQVGPGKSLTRATEPAWDSLRHIEILLAIEGICEVRFDEDEMGSLDTFEKLVQSVERHRAT